MVAYFGEFFSVSDVAGILLSQQDARVGASILGFSTCPYLAKVAKQLGPQDRAWGPNALSGPGLSSPISPISIRTECLRSRCRHSFRSS